MKNNFSINQNIILTAISGFGALATISGNLTISGNTSLSSCCAFFPIADGSLVPGGSTNTISSNATGCSSPEEIITDCTIVATLTINADADVPSGVARLKRITGDLTIGGTITEFPNFAALEVIEGNLDINGITTATLTALADIFPVLDSVRGNLRIRSNTQVATITGFANLDSVGGALFISNNNVLTALPTFSTLTTIEEVTIQNNTALTAFSGFEALTEITKRELFITSNAKLETIAGFDVLESVERDFNISGNPLLTTLPTFNALTSVGRNFTITGNTALTIVSGFGVLATITGDFSVRGNTQLASCCGLLSIADGSLVPTGTTTIENNASGCNNKTEITSDCLLELIIDDPTDIPSNVATIQGIRGDLTIGGTITSFPDFAALEVVEGNLTIDAITTATLTDLANIFPALQRVGGGLQITSNAHVETITGFGVLNNVGGFFNFQSNAALTAMPAF